MFWLEGHDVLTGRQYAGMIRIKRRGCMVGWPWRKDDGDYHPAARRYTCRFFIGIENDVHLAC